MKAVNPFTVNYPELQGVKTNSTEKSILTKKAFNISLKLSVTAIKLLQYIIVTFDKDNVEINTKDKILKDKLSLSERSIKAGLSDLQSHYIVVKSNKGANNFWLNPLYFSIYTTGKNNDKL